MTNFKKLKEENQRLKEIIRELVREQDETKRIKIFESAMKEFP